MHNNSDEILISKDFIRSLASHYRSGESNLGKEFFSPCLRHCLEYQRAVGYFSSKALLAWLDVLPRFSEESVKIYLLISPELSSGDRIALQNALNEQERQKLRKLSAESLIEELLNEPIVSDYIERSIQLFAWMVANDHLVLQFAFPEHVEKPGIFHEKIGIFRFPWGDKVAFTGSANESENGYERNYESIDVYRSWISGDEERVRIKQEQFEEAWAAKAVGLKVLPLSLESAALIRSKAPDKKPSVDLECDLKKSIAKDKPNTYLNGLTNSQQDKRDKVQWRHQDEAIAAFLKIRHGVLEMATGTGKTRTAINILSVLDQNNEIDGIVISTEGTDLLDQWRKEIEPWAIKRLRPYRVLRHYDKHHELGEFALNHNRAILVISREQLASLFNRLDSSFKERLIIIHDEVHGLGSPSLRTKLAGEHQAFGYRLGLSATPEREYDQEGTKFIFEEIGDVFFQFGLKEAIERGILCEFDYVPLTYPVTEGDRQRLQQVYAKRSARQREGRPMTKQELWTELARVYKTAEKKPEIFAEYLSLNPQVIKSTIIFVEDKAYGEPILEALDSYTHRYRTYYAEDDRRNLVDFSRGSIDCLITCHRISQGIDIRNLQNVILFSSSRARLETIQRIGRCLRTDPSFPEKRAMIVDFVRSKEDEDNELNADEARCIWLSALSQTRRIE
ncbi:DEAD/DEAH box helicase family protein [Leptolyngbya sp. KIOST-1]|uniref:DEAD/DEAH box helicase family protein n=1 Tax=Leptolyngbya sp. KIOST-1 TaxID=1229172 RepID=UPI000907A646|nr:DEAD/DEAH box helicase family protein [Leptolyngbya sp. KIOST-1]